MKKLFSFYIEGTLSFKIEILLTRSTKNKLKSNKPMKNGKYLKIMFMIIFLNQLNL